jgi:GrpB-like predicted nucleotidyltransferase (UPF0157 family)
VTVEPYVPSIVELVPHDPQWSVRYDRERTRLRDGLGDIAVRIEHVGSTAVAGLEAKPVVDIQLSVGSLDLFETYAEPLGELHVCEAESSPPGWELGIDG